MTEAIKPGTDYELAPTLERDGFEEVECRLNDRRNNGDNNPRFPNNTRHIHLGPSRTTSDFQRYLIYYPERAEAVGPSDHNPATRQILIDVLDQSGFTRFIDTLFESHVVAARTKPSQNHQSET